MKTAVVILNWNGKTLLEEFLPLALGAVAPAYAENWMILFGPLLIMVVLFGRGGLIGLLDKAGFGRISKRKMAVK